MTLRRRRSVTVPAHHLFLRLHAPVAQCIEHRASNAEVAGESPAGSAISTPNQPPMHSDRERFDKHLIRLGRELRDLWRRRYIRVTLREPIQRGWRRTHVLAPSTLNRADKDVLTELLKVIGTVQFRNSPDFRQQRGRGKRRRFFEIEQPLRVLRVGEWERLRLPEAWKRYFHQKKQCYFRSWHDTLVFANTHAFDLKIEPNWVTETTIGDPAVARRIYEIETWLWNHNAMHRLERLWGVSNRWRDPRRESILRRMAQDELHAAMLNPSEVDLAASGGRRRLSLRCSLAMLFSPA
jgi:hypothetical protein